MGGSKPQDAKAGKKDRARGAPATGEEKVSAAVSSMRDKGETSERHAERKHHKNKRFGHN